VQGLFFKSKKLKPSLSFLAKIKMAAATEIHRINFALHGNNDILGGCATPFNPVMFLQLMPLE
jgi:hypothetical protein